MKHSIAVYCTIDPRFDTIDYWVVEDTSNAASGPTEMGFGIASQCLDQVSQLLTDWRRRSSQTAPGSPSG